MALIYIARTSTIVWRLYKHEIGVLMKQESYRTHLSLIQKKIICHLCTLIKLCDENCFTVNQVISLLMCVVKQVGFKSSSYTAVVRRLHALIMGVNGSYCNLGLLIIQLNCSVSRVK